MKQGHHGDPIGRWMAATALCVLVLGASPRLQTQANAQLLSAAERGDAAAAAAAIARGADVNEANSQGLTPLFVAADRANADVVKLLLERGADPNRTQELMWGRTALSVASVSTSEIKAERQRADIVKLLVDHGAGNDGQGLTDLVRGGYVDALRTIIARGQVKRPYLNLALAMARRVRNAEAIDVLTRAGATEPGPLDSPRSAERVKMLGGVYRDEAGQELMLAAGEDGDQMLLERTSRPPVMMFPVELNLLKSEDRALVIATVAGELPPRQVTLREAGRERAFVRIGDARSRPSTAPAAMAAPPADRRAPVPPSVTAGPKNWPSFRGPGGSGVAASVNLPTTWDLEKSINIKWRTPIPGFAHSSPIIWGNRVIVTSAVAADDGNATFRHGESAGVASTSDDTPHSWRVYALDRDTGKILWEREAHKGVPKTQRHVMASQANSTPATDGQHIVVFFGSEGLYCYDLDGKLLWQRDLGTLRANRILDASYEWNTASSPIIYKNRVILQLDLMEQSHIAAFDITTGKEVWRTERDEIPSWGTPLLYEGAPSQIVTAAGKFARGYDPDSGKELWKLGKHSEFPTPTPIAGLGLIFVSSGTGSTVQPIYAIRPDATGDITLRDDEASNQYVVWSKLRGGPSIPTPILYDDLLYVCSTTGILAVYDAATGQRVYQERLTRGGSYSASAVAADGKLYFASEDGEVIVVKAGRTFEKLATNPMGELMMATPAIAPNTIILRTLHHLVAVSESSGASKD